MNVGSNYSFDMNFEMDEEGEGMVDPQRIGGRSSNYTVDEDILQCKRYLKVGMDASVGTDQTRDTYWFRMKEYFDKHNTSGNERSDRSLRSRWSLINTDCQKWSAAMAQVDNMNPSGINDRDRVRNICLMHSNCLSLFNMTNCVFFM